jgi:hypothetical protein
MVWGDTYSPHIFTLTFILKFGEVENNIDELPIKIGDLKVPTDITIKP